MNLLDYKKRVFRDRIEGYLNLPHAIKNKVTMSLLQDENTFILPEKVKTDNKDGLRIVDEVRMILNELEIFERENRKKKQMYLLEKLSEQLADDFLDVDELTDFVFFGDKLCNIEKRHLEKEKHKSNVFNSNLVVRINKILQDDDKGLNRAKRKWLSLKRLKCVKCKTWNGAKVYKCYRCRKFFHKVCISYKLTKQNNKKRRICKTCN
jgi:hypothetical protein